MLGYETAQLIDTAAQAAGGDLRNTTGLRDALGSVAFVGPRGQVAMQPATRAATSGLLVREVRRQRGRLVNAPIDERSPLDELDPRLAPLRASVKTGWTNAYLCVA